ncbi:O-antigen ligase family protein [Bifidobacterium oedipodis]|uniref:FhiA protein n=1 Tax=Bifidobacterium oedipodis TaxID=2675322 RepID=A0A7Y0ERT4_9BIFI|nr:O-antigen ligase family protein [Bifidobacterium sp. DSM 109957]NMM95241.1 fhiA protein [Bifidobacterium sp. DSM 109957]
MDTIFTFITMAFPKAGAQVSGLPLTLNLLLTAYVVLRHPNQTLLSIQKYHDLAVAYALLFVFGLHSMLLAVAQGVSPYALSQMLIVIGSPLVAVSALRLNAEKFTKIVICAMLIVNLYAVAQYTAGIENTAIEGITYTYGQSIFDKPIGLSVDGTAEKMISTYQNGNSFGLFDALGLSYLLNRLPIDHKWNIAKLCALFLGFIGFMLSGSRSIQIPFILVLLFILIQYIKRTPSRLRQNIIGGCITGLVIMAIFLSYNSTMMSKFLDRLITQTVADPTASGRTEQWNIIFSSISNMDTITLIRQFLLGKNPQADFRGEGLPDFFATFGLPCTIAFYSGLILLIIHCWKSKYGKTTALGILSVSIAFCFDQSYYYPPDIMNVYLFAAAVYLLSNQKAMQTRCLERRFA